MKIIDSFEPEDTHPALCLESFVDMVCTYDKSMIFSDSYNNRQGDLATIFVKKGFVCMDDVNFYDNFNDIGFKIIKNLLHRLDYAHLYFRFPDGSYLSCKNGKIQAKPFNKIFDNVAVWYPPSSMISIVQCMPFTNEYN